MRVQAYTAFEATLQITVATPRSEPAPSTKFYAATIHEDYCALVDDLLLEHKHCGADALVWPAAKRLQTYLPVVAGAAIYAFRAITPAGAPRDIDADWQLEIMRIRYALSINLLPSAFLGDYSTRAISRNVQAAVKGLFKAQNVPELFIPGDQGERLGDRTDIDIICEVGAASARTGVEIPTPPQG